MTTSKSAIQSEINLNEIFFCAVNAVQAKTIFQSNNFRIVKDGESENIKLSFNNNDISFDISGDRQCHLVGFGKGVFGMAHAIGNVLGERLKYGILSVPFGTGKQFYNIKLHSTIEVFEGAENNLPDSSAERTAKRIVSFVEKLTERDVLFVLVTGGGSALLPLPCAGVTLEEKRTIIKQLASKGANISDINHVRIDLSRTKGGKLAESAKNIGTVIALILSDTIGDSIDLVASGPTVTFKSYEPSSIAVLKRYELWKALPAHIKHAIIENSKLKLETRKNVFNLLIANNQTAIDAARNQAEKQHLPAIVLSTAIDGTVHELSDAYIQLAKLIKQKQKEQLSVDQFQLELLTLQQIFHMRDSFLININEFIANAKTNENGFCLIGGGEPTVKITGNGIGGRNQELALRFSQSCFYEELLHDVQLLSAGTDGIDGME